VSSKLPLLSSREVTAALTRLGFEPAHGDNHQTWEVVDKTTDVTLAVTVVPLGKKEIPRPTLKSILALGGINLDDFLNALK
jgi:predicted RNA binding protein YcfA (HicA-like mRNA interferase family)